MRIEAAKQKVLLLLVNPTVAYGKNVIKDSGTGTIVYMPPEAKDVPGRMRNLLSWIKENEALPYVGLFRFLAKLKMTDRSLIFNN